MSATTEISDQSTEDSTVTSSSSGQSDNSNNVQQHELFQNFDFSVEQIKELQRNDTELNSLINYLENDKLPKGQKKIA